MHEARVASRLSTGRRGRRGHHCGHLQVTTWTRLHLTWDLHIEDDVGELIGLYRRLHVEAFTYRVTPSVVTPQLSWMWPKQWYCGLTRLCSSSSRSAQPARFSAGRQRSPWPSGGPGLGSGSGSGYRVRVRV